MWFLTSIPLTQLYHKRQGVCSGEGMKAHHGTQDLHHVLHKQLPPQERRIQVLKRDRTVKVRTGKVRTGKGKLWPLYVPTRRQGHPGAGDICSISATSAPSEINKIFSVFFNQSNKTAPSFTQAVLTPWLINSGVKQRIQLIKVRH